MKTIGIIGGSGLYEMEGLADVERVSAQTPWGAPSDEIVVGRLGDARLAFLPRHGRGHRLLPHEINYRANIYGMKQLGVRHLLSVSAVGSLRPEIHPGHVVVPDQLIDRTRARPSTFFGDGIAGHVQFADPMCPRLRAVLIDSARQAGATVHPRGTYVVMEGPAFSTRAESNLYRSWGADVIGMTNLPEAKLAREAEICYATLALSTDYDCWHEDAEEVSVEAVLQVLQRNIGLARATVREAVLRIGALPEAEPPACPCPSALRHAVMTPRERFPEETFARLSLLIGRYFPGPAQ
jgi:5'-methylthioadenosine phosphorylase